MKNLFTIFICLAFLSCHQNGSVKDEQQQEVTTAVAAPVVCVFTLGDTSMKPDLRVFGFTGTNQAPFLLYNFNPQPPRVVENGLVSSYAAVAYNWKYKDTFSAIITTCIIDNVAACGQDFVFSESQGTKILDALGREYTIYKGILRSKVFFNGELVGDQEKRTFEPSEVADTATCTNIWYGTFNVIHSRNADLYFNPNRIPRNTNGKFVVRLDVNPPDENGCRAIQESDYSNNRFITGLAKEGSICIEDPTALQANLPKTPTAGFAKLSKAKKSVIITCVNTAERFRIYRSDQTEPITRQPIYTNTFTDSYLPKGNLNNITYTIVAENEGIGFSQPTKPISITR